MHFRGEPVGGVAERLVFQGLTITCRAETAAQLLSLRRQLFPLFADAIEAGDAASAAVEVEFVHSDATVLACAGVFAGSEGHDKIAAVDARRAYALSSPQGQVVYLPGDGVAFLLDRERRRLRIAHATRTPWPAVTLAESVREIWMRYAESEGWYLYHAGAVATPRGVAVIVGAGGAGKTTLIGGLVRQGAGFVANERCFLRSRGGRVEALTFPQTVHVGIGTALQFEGLAGLIPSPDGVLCPQRRFDRRRVAAAAAEVRMGLPDKLALLSSEFCERVGGGPPLLGGTVFGIVEPRLKLDAAALVCHGLPHEAVRRLLSSNRLGRGRDRFFPEWLDLGFAASPDQVAELSALPAVATGYLCDRDGFRNCRDPVAFLDKALERRASDLTSAAISRR